MKVIYNEDTHTLIIDLEGAIVLTPKKVTNSNIERINRNQYDRLTKGMNITVEGQWLDGEQLYDKLNKKYFRKK